jgi:hypothetical protein
MANKPFTAAEINEWLRRAEARWSAQHDLEKREAPRCPVCGCYQFLYQGDKQVCADCYR